MDQCSPCRIDRGPAVQLAGLPRSSYYYTPTSSETPENLALMRVIARVYTEYPSFGSPKMTDALWQRGYRVNVKRVARLMRVMGLQAKVPGPHTSRPHPEHRVYPYLLRGLQIRAPNEVWADDITYIPLRHGFMYLLAILDWFSRYVVAWELSSTMETKFCVETLERALRHQGPPGIFNTDQGSPFTSEDSTERLVTAGIQISMDGRGRALDTVFVERLWRTIKYEHIYLRDYADGTELREGLARYFRFYQAERPHQALDCRAPAEVYFARKAIA